MKHVVIVLDSVISKRISAVELARRLSRSGYHITFIGKGGEYRQIAGFDYIRLDLELEKVGPSPLSPDSISGKNDRGLGILKEWDEKLEALSPDLLLIDVEMHLFVLAAIASKYPVALFSVFFNMRKHKSMPPLHFNMIPGMGLTGHPFIIELAWLRFRLSKFVSNLRERLKKRGKDELSRFDNYATQLGLSLKEHVDCYQWLIPFLYRRLPVLSLSPLEVEFPFRPHHTITYVGPMISSDRTNLPFLTEHREQNAKIHDLIASYRQHRNGRRLVYCSFGCFFGGNDRAFWRKLIEAFKYTEWDVIFVFGNRNIFNLQEKIPDNIHSLEFAPQTDILSVADCAVIHAGLISILECIYFEVPMVTYPFNVNDQLGNAARVVYHNIGVRGFRDRDSPEEIRQHVEWVMQNQQIKTNLKAMRHHVGSYEKNNTVVDAVDRIIENHEQIQSV